MKRYFFEEVEKCEMCGDATFNHKILGQRLNRSQGLSPKRKEGISVSVKKCTVCNLIYASPQPIPFNIEDHYGTPPEQYWGSPKRLTWNATDFSRQITTAKALLDFRNGMRALDVGAGLGKAMLSLKNAGFEAFGCEPSSCFYERAISQMNIDKRFLTLGMIEDMNYADNSFDFITFGAVFEHLYHPASSLERVMQWLRPGGIVHIEVPSSAHLVSKMLNAYYRLRGTNYVTHLSPMHAPYHLYEFHLKSFERLSTRLHYDIAEHYFDVGTIFNIPKFLHLPLEKYMKFTNTGMQLTVYLRKPAT